MGRCALSFLLLPVLVQPLPLLNQPWTGSDPIDRSIDQVGALVVKDVKPYEFMKLRLLNGGHSCLSYISVLCGYSYVDDAMADPQISGAIAAAALRTMASFYPASGRVILGFVTARVVVVIVVS